MEPFETHEYHDMVISLYYDDEPMNPREDDNLGTMFCLHNRYDLGDKDAPPPEEDYIYLPLYLYDHSGITMSTEPFSCPWDSGMVGYIYVSLDDIRKEYGVTTVTDELIEKVKAHLSVEVDTYDKYLRGEAYGYIITDEHGEPIDSCWGYDDLGFCRAQAHVSADYMMESVA
jgi:hypothetical protein